jgi:hypothetical protein
MQLKFQATFTSALGLIGSTHSAFSPHSAAQSVAASFEDRPLGRSSPASRLSAGSSARLLPSPVHRDLMRALRALPDDTAPSRNTDAARLDLLGSIGCINEPIEKVTPETIDLLALYTGANVAFSTQEAPPNIFADFPKEITNVVLTRSTGTLGASDTVIFPDCSDKKITGDAPFLKKNGRVIISVGDIDSAIKKTALLHAIRPDLALYGHATNHAEDNAMPTPATPVAASYAVADMLVGERAVVARPLGDSDANWLSRLSGVAIDQGAVIMANFNRAGTIDRVEFEAKFRAEPTSLQEQLAQTVGLNQRMLRDMAGPIDDARLATAVKDQLGRPAYIPGVLVDRQASREQMMTLGPTVVYGASGNIGNALSKALCANGVQVCGIVRQPSSTIFGVFAELTEPKPLASTTVPAVFVPNTVFLTSSASWPKDADGNIVFDRSKLLEANVKILTPVFKDLSPQARTVVISNPCSEMAYLGWLLRPDLADKIFSHSGTDVTRQRNRAPFPEDSFTVGPHSPAQVNVKRNRLGKLEIDRRIPLLGQQHQERSSDGNSVTIPTATAAIWEGISIVNNKAQSLAMPLSADEARTLSAFMAQQGQATEVNEGIAITLPRDAQRQIRWDMLTEAAEQLPGFSEKFRHAISAMEDGRSALLQSVVDTVNLGRPEEAMIDRQWVLDNRGAVVSDAVQEAQQKNR